MTGQEIAVIGMAGRFPGGRSIQEFWTNLEAGIESIRTLPENELLSRGVLKSEIADPAYVRAAAVLDGVDHFDAGFFGFSPKDAAIIDPQHRHFLECAWEALEHAGHSPDIFPGSIGIYAGSGLSAYLIHNLLANRNLVQSAGLFLLRQTGNDKDVLATRVSYQLNLRGPSINVQTACSTSLVAIHMACQSLLNHECDMALAGGVTIEIPHGVGYTYREGEILSQDGHCRSFDARSTGTVFGSGLGIVVLRRLEDAIQSGDYIHAVVLGSAINNDGSRKVGYLAPSIEGQAEVIAEALNVAGVNASDISYVETHGTGTKVGDPIEISGLTQAFRQFTSKKQFCAIGSVKSNVGHLDTAAGVAGLIKTVLALEHGQIPATLHFEKPNPHIDFANSPFFVNAQLRDWKASAVPRRAGVTSLGIGGTNAHVILEEAPAVEHTRNHRPWQLLTLSAKSTTSLDAAVAALAKHWEEHPELNPADVAFTWQLGRTAFKYRGTVVCRNPQEAIASLRASDSRHSAEASSTDREVVFMFPGQGSQYVNMGLELYRSEPEFRQWIDQCCELLQPHLGLDLRKILYPPEQEPEECTRQLTQTRLTQPALFAIEYSLAKLWMSWGIQPRAMVGHSIGEYVAACLAGVFPLDVALAIVAERARLMQSVRPGAMTVVPLSEPEVLPLLPGSVSLAAINGPRQCVASGPLDAIEKLEAQLLQREISCRRLQTSHAFHSPMTETILAPFADVVRRFPRSAPQIPYLSCVTGQWIIAADVGDPEYWAKQLRGTVRFDDCLRELFRVPDGVLLEVGPGQTLGGLARQHPGRPKEQWVVRSMRQGNETAVSDLQTLLKALGDLWCAGTCVNWAGFRQHDRGYRVPLPTYQFERKRYWIDPDERPAIAHEQPSRRRAVAEWFYRPAWKRAPRALAAGADSAPSMHWLIFMDESLGPVLAKQLRRMGQIVTTVTAGRRFLAGDKKYTIRRDFASDFQAVIGDLVSKNRSPSRIVHLWAINTPSGLEKVEDSQNASFYSLLFLAQALGEHDFANLMLVAVSDRMQQIANEPSLHPESATLLGPCKVIPEEYPGVHCCSLDLSLADKDYERVAQQIINESMTAPWNPVVARRGEDRWVQTFEPVAADPLNTKLRLITHGVYLITGGLGGIGLTIAARLAKEAGARLVLTGRTPFPPPDQWEALLAAGDSEPLARTIRAVQQLEATGAEVQILQADVTNLEEMQAALAAAQQRFGAIHGVIHAAGVLDDGLIQFKTRQRAAAVLDPKLKGTLVLDKLLKDGGLDFLVLFSSISSIVPPAGQVDYAAANAFLDAFARSKPIDSRRPTLAINWTLWGEVGMGAQERPGSRRLPPIQSHALLSTGVTDASGEIIYSSKLSCATHWILDHHRLRNGTALFPGTGYIEMAGVALTAGDKDRPVELRDVFFAVPFIFDADETREVRVRIIRSEGSRRFSVVSKNNAIGEWQEYAYGMAGSPESDAPPAVRPDQIIARCNVREIALPDRKTKQERYFTFGHRWRTLQKIYVGKGEGVSVLELPAEFQQDLEEHRVHPALFDIASGSALYLIADYDSSDDMYLPLGYKRVTIWGRLPRTVYSHIRVSGSNTGRGEVSTFDISILDEAGRILIDVERFSMRRISDQRMLSAAGEPRGTARRFAGTALGDPDRRNAILPGEGAEAFLRILSQAELNAAMVVSPNDLSTILKTTRTTEPAAAAQAGSVPASQPAVGAEAPLDEVERTLMGWWNELLGTTQIRVDDDFFDLGGHSLVAAQLFAKIKKTYRVDLNLALLFEVRTIEKLAKVIGQELEQKAGQIAAAPKPWSPLVPIQSQGELPPLYFVSGAGGHALIFQTLSTYLGLDQPVYALQPRGLDGRVPFMTRMEDIAAYYIQEIKKTQPTGPYHLAGYSFGGIVTFEMVRQLRINGDEVGLLVLLDTALRYWEGGEGSLSVDQRLKLYGTRLKNFLGGSDRLAYLWEAIHGRAHLAMLRAFRAAGRTLPKAIGSIEDANWFAAANYTAQFYPGRMVLIRCSEASEAERDERLLGWRGLAAHIDVRETPGDHTTLVKEPNVIYLAETLRLCMQEWVAARATPPDAPPERRDLRVANS